MKNSKKDEKTETLKKKNQIPRKSLPSCDLNNAKICLGSRKGT